MLPPIYQDAKVRNVTPVCPERNRLGLGLELASGEVVRVALDEAGVAFLAMCLQAYWDSAAGRRVTLLLGTDQPPTQDVTNV